MIGIGTEGSAGTVPQRVTGPGGPAPRGLLDWMAMRGPVAVLLAGFVLNVVWVGVLGWAAFRTVRWLFA